MKQNLTSAEIAEKNRLFHLELEERARVFKIKRKAQQKQDKKYRTRMSNKLKNHINNCKECREGFSSCNKANHYGLIFYGMNKNFEKISREMGKNIARQEHERLVPAKTRLETI